MNEIQNINISAIVPSSTNPRQYFDKDQLAELTASIREQGVIQPIIVRPTTDSLDKGIQYEIVAGERRFRASKDLGLASIPAVVREYTDSEVLEVQVIENLQRADVHPMDEAVGYQRFIDQGATVQTVADRVGKPASYIYQRLQLTNLISPLQKAFWKGAFTVAHAIQLARLDKTAQKKCADQFGDKWPTTASLAEWIKNNVFLNIANAPFDKKDAELFPKAGACSACPKRTGANKSLFDDIGKDDMCLDSACFAKKRELFAAKLVMDAEDSETPLLQISTNMQTEKEGVLGYAKWNYSSEDALKAGKAHRAVVVEGNGVGEVKIINMAYSSSSPEPKKQLTPEEKLARAEKRVTNQHAKIDRTVRVEALKAFGQKVTKFTPEDIKELAFQLFVSMSNHDRKIFVEEILGKEAKAWDNAENFKKLAPKTDVEMLKFLALMAYTPCIDTTRKNNPLLTAAADRKVNVEKIRETVAEANPIVVPKLLQEPKVEERKAA